MLVIPEIVQEISGKMEPMFTQNILITFRTFPQLDNCRATDLAAEGLRSVVLRDLQQGALYTVLVESARGCATLLGMPRTIMYAKFLFKVTLRHVRRS